MTPEAIRSTMARALRVDVARLRDDALLTEVSTGSFALIDAVIRIQDALGVRLVQADLLGVRTVGALVRLLERKTGS